jgi:predicted SAM-dependent methyltransferase
VNILNLGAGKLDPLVDDKIIEPWFLVNLDSRYFYGDDPASIEREYNNWKGKELPNRNLNCICDAFEFMERTQITFDRVVMYRFLEHIPFTKLLYFIYLVSTITNKNGLVDVIVPNYKILAKMILDEVPGNKDFEANNILTTTELLNEPGDPHASVWTPDRAKYFWELEGRFKVNRVIDRFNFDGRDIYMRFMVERT